jgi:hypothetical protein
MHEAAVQPDRYSRRVYHDSTCPRFGFSPWTALSISPTVPGDSATPSIASLGPSRRSLADPRLTFTSSAGSARLNSQFTFLFYLAPDANATLIQSPTNHLLSPSALAARCTLEMDFGAQCADLKYKMERVSVSKWGTSSYPAFDQ